MNTRCNFHYKSGSYSGRIDDNYLVNWEKYVYSDTWTPINNSQDTYYTVSGWIYVDNVANNDAQIWLSTRKSGETGYPSGNYSSKTTQRGRWEYLSKTVLVPADVRELNIRIDNNKKGKVWFDDVKIVKGNASQTVIVEESNYYPFGLKHKGYNNVISSNGNSTANKYGYQSKELQEELGLEWHDFGARNYDASLGRWMNLDPLSDKYESVSPYNFVLNNPMIHTDPDGRSVDGEFELIGGEWKKTSTKGDDIGVDFYHTDSKDSKGNNTQKTYATDRAGNWNVINNGRYALQGDSRSSDTDWSTVYNEFLDGNGPERSVFEGDHQSITDIKKNYLFKNAVENFDESGDSKGGGEVSFLPIWDNVGTGSNIQVQMMGSFNASFYKLGDKTLSLVQDSKSRTSYYYHLPVTNYPRSLTRYKTFKGGVHYNGVSKNIVIPHKQESTTYQTYLFFK